MTPPPPHPDPELTKRLVRLADDFGNRAQRQRSSARWNLFWVVATVLLLTGGVLALPPLVDVVEDRILSLTGRETSQLDLQDEIQSLVSEVQNGNATLLELLDKRDRAIAELQGLETGHAHVFEPETVRLPDGAESVQVHDAAELGQLTFAAGGYTGTDLGTFGEAPALFFRLPGTGAGGWLQADVTSLPGFGTIDHLLPQTAGSAFPQLWAVGSYESGVALHRLTAADELGPFSLASIPIKDTDLTEFDLARGLALSPDGEMLAIGLHERNNVAGLGDGLTGGTATILITGREVIFTDGIITTFADERTVLSVQTIPGAVIVDMIWLDNALHALLDTGTGFDIVTIEQDAPDGPFSSTDAISERILAVPLGFRVTGNEGTLLADVINTASSTSQAFQSYQYEPDTGWSAGDIGPQIAAGNFSPDFFGHGFGTSPTIYYGGELSDTLVSLRFGSRDLSQEVQLVTKDDFPFDFAPFVFSDETLRLNPWSGLSERTVATLFYAEADLIRVDPVDDETPLREFLFGTNAGKTPSTTPLGTTELSVGPDYVAAHMAPSLRQLDNGWLLEREVLRRLTNAQTAADEWRAAWDNRERSAVSLERFRQSEEAGDLWRQVSSITARLAIVALLVYLVNILVNLYRYNMRLAGFYQARGDALTVALATGSDPIAALQDLAKTSTPEDVTFGNRPVPPTDTLINAMTEMAKLGRSGG